MSMKLQNEVKEAYKALCKEAINNELVEDQEQFKEVFVKTMNNTECQDLLARHFDGDNNNAGFQKTVLNYVRTEFMTLLRVQTEKFRFFLSGIDHTTLAERDDKTIRYPAAFGFAFVQKWDKDSQDWEEYHEAEIQAFRDAADCIRVSPKEFYQGNFEVVSQKNGVYTLRVHPQASRFDKVNAPNAWQGAKEWLKDNYDMSTIADIADNPSTDGTDYKMFELTLISSYMRASSTGKQLGFMEFVDDSVPLSLAGDRSKTVRSIVPQELAATYARGSTFLVLAIVEVNPQYGPQLNVKAIEEIIPIKRRTFKTNTTEMAQEEDEEEIDASAWIQSKVDEDDEDEWEDSDDEEDDSDEEEDSDDEEEDSDDVDIEDVDEDDDEEDDWEDLDDEF